jgi:L-ascorbate metabolism protein UlaG (beta-lactamase superfamily)
LIEPAVADDAFLADVAAAVDPELVYLWWLGQSGFLIGWRRRYLLIDPYLSDSLTRKYAGTGREHVRMTRRVVDPGRLDFVDVVCSTHGHTDHLDAETLKPIIASGASLVCPAANSELAAERLGRAPDVGMIDGDMAPVAGFHVELVPAAHPELTPEYAGYVVTCGGTRIYHSGDSVVYPGMAERLRPGQPTVALLPINGALGNMSGPEAARLAHAIRAELAVPCHYEMFEFNTASPAAFVAECERLGQPYVVLRAGQRLSVPISLADQRRRDG